MIKRIISNYKIITIIFLLLAIAASIQAVLLDSKTFKDGGSKYTQYNNYKIFEYSFYHLKDGKDLYLNYLSEHYDLFKYTPTFAMFFGFFTLFPDWLGLSLWNMLNAIVFVLSIYYLPKLNDYQKGLILVICLIEMITSLQNSQSNVLIAGLIILAFGLLEKDRYLWASFMIVSAVFIKLFGLVAFSLFLFYPKKWKLAVYTAFWTLILFLLPLLYIGIDQYKFLLKSYLQMLTSDHTASYGYSAMGWLHAWFGIEMNKNFIVAIGVVLFMLPFLRFKQFSNYTFRLLALCSVLIWVVIFNHKAESPTFILAMAGVSIWFVISKKNYLNVMLFTLAFILTSLSPTDIFPTYLHEEYVRPFMLKVFPIILIWLKITYDMLVLKDDKITDGLLSKEI
jgi:hypothetical protein